MSLHHYHAQSTLAYKGSRSPVLSPLLKQMDLPSAMTAVDCIEALDLQRITNKPWQIE